MTLQEHYITQGLGSEFKTIQQYIGLRQINYISELPMVSKNKVIQAYVLAKKIFPEAEIYLVGSYANGAYRDESTPKNVLEAFEKVYQKKGFSDVDLWVEGNDNIININDWCQIIPQHHGNKIRLIYDF